MSFELGPSPRETPAIATSRQDASPERSTAPPRQGAVLVALILVAAVANLNLAVANVALPDIGKAFDAGQTAPDVTAIAFSLGLAPSVLWLGAVGDRYGRKMLLLVGTSLAVSASLIAAWAPSIGVLIGARLLLPRLTSAWRVSGR